ncbi:MULTISPECIES: hypothetical protein [Halomonas]
MMSKELLKKAGILGLTFGLMASPLAFAESEQSTSIDQNQDITADDEAMDPQGTHTDTASEQNQHDLTHDVGDDASDMDPNSTSNSDDANFDSTEELPEENSGM